MKEKNKTAIIIEIISVTGGIIGCIFGINATHQLNSQNKYIQSQIVNIEGNSNTVTINNVEDLVTEYIKLLDRNEVLEAQNTAYFTQLTEANSKVMAADTKIEEFENQMNAAPNITYHNLGLSIDGTDIPINKTNSTVTIDGNDYYSFDIINHLIPENKNVTTKEETIFIGKVTYDKASLFEQWEVNCRDYYSGDTSTKDSYGYIRSKSIYCKGRNGEIIYSLNAKYKNFKCTISVSEEFEINDNCLLTITADENVYSFELDKTTEPFEIDIPINNCKLLTFESDVSYYSKNIIISDAYVYN